MKSIKFKNNNYLASEGITHNRKKLNELLDKLFFKPGDSFSYWIKTTAIPNTTSTFRITVPLGKSVWPGTTISVTVGTCHLYQDGNSSYTNLTNTSVDTISSLTNNNTFELTVNTNTTIKQNILSTVDMKITVTFI